jgi:hypothetical protein
MAYSPSFEVYELVERVSKGDVAALRELWPHLFDTPFDASRTLQDLADDVAKRLSELTKANGEASVQDRKAELERQMLENAIAIGEVLKSLIQKKK